MKKTMFMLLKNALFTLGLMTALTGPAGAVTLSLSPSDLTIPVSTNFSINLILSDLDVQGRDEVGGFDVDVLYDPSQIQFLTWNLGAQLGDVGLSEAWDLSWGDMGGGVIDVAELSFLAATDLQTLQTSSSFVLATLDFYCLAYGDSTIEIDSNDVWLGVTNRAGTPLPVTVSGGVTVSQVPAPAPLLLIAAATAALGLTRRTGRVV